MTKIKPIAVMLTDTHQDEGNLELVEDIFDQLLALCVSLGLKYCFHLGDMFNNRTKQSLELLLLLKKIIKKFEEQRIILYCIGGNHDKVDLEDKTSYLSVYKGTSKNFVLFEDAGYVVIDDICYCFLPYFLESGGEVAEQLSNLIEQIEDIEEPKVLMTHLAIEGVRNNDGSVVDNDLTKDLFKFFDKVFVGHYHNKQSLSKKIQYIGSAYQSNFGEDDRKGFTVLRNDLSTKQVISNFPKFIHVKINADNEQEVISYLSENGQTKNNIRLTIIGDRDKLATTQRRLSKYDHNIDIRYEDISENLSFDEDVVHTTMQFDNKNLMKHWLKYSSSNDCPKQVRDDGFELLKSLK